MSKPAAVIAILVLTISMGLSPGYGFESETWPEEGVAHFRAKRSLPVYEESSTRSPMAAGKEIPKGSEFNFKKMIYRTIKPGLISVRRPTTITVRSLGRIEYLSKEDYYSDHHPDKKLTLQAGDSLEYLQYRAEGSILIRVAGIVYEFDTTEFEAIPVDQEPIVEWWVKVTDNRGKEIGWALSTRNRLRSLREHIE